MLSLRWGRDKISLKIFSRNETWHKELFSIQVSLDKRSFILVHIVGILFISLEVIMADIIQAMPALIFYFK